MVNSISSTSVQLQASLFSATNDGKSVTTKSLSLSASKDTIQFGQNGPLSTEESVNVVLERAFEKLRSVVSDAKEALGISADAELDTSAEATANRIADFALGAFDSYRQNHTELSDDDARTQFVEFIGGAIQQGISEARDILTALNSLTDDVDSGINSTFEIIQTRLNDFAANGEV